MSTTTGGSDPDTLVLKDNWSPHPGQRAIIRDPTRFRVCVCGRRWGKSEMAAHLAFWYAWENPGSVVWWVGPTYDDANEYGFDKIYPYLSDDVLAKEPKWSKPREIYLVNGSVLSFRTSDRMSSLRGPGIDFLVMDECANQPREALTQELRPALSDTQGDALFIGTPGGRDWFFEWYQRGQHSDFAHVSSYRAPSVQAARFAGHPLTEQEVLDARQDMTDREWRQEYGAVFIDDVGGVFRGVGDRNVVGYDWRSYDGDPPYRHGWDFGRHQNWTVGITLDADGFLVNFTRIQRVRWSRIQATIENVNQRYPGVHSLDATRDERIVEDLEDAGVRVEAVNFTTEKEQLIDELAIALENEELLFPGIDELVAELQVYEYEVTSGGRIKYGPPEDWNDDCVDSLALAHREPETGPRRATWGSSSS